MEKNYILELRHVCKSYQKRVILKNINKALETGKILGCTRYDFLIGKYLHRTITAMNRVIQRGKPYGEEKRGTAAANGYAYYGRWQRTNQRKRVSEIVRSAAGDSAEVNQPADAGSDQA